MLQLDSDDLLDNPGEAPSAFYEGPGVSGPGAGGGCGLQSVPEAPLVAAGGGGVGIGSRLSRKALCQEGSRGQSLRAARG